MPPGCALFGDDQYLFVIRPDQQQTATVLRAADGQTLDTRPMSGRLRLGTLGRFVLQFQQRTTGPGAILELWDPWEQRAVWSGVKFDGGAQVVAADRETAAVFQNRTGRFSLVRMSDGQKLIDAEVRPESQFSDPPRLPLQRQHRAGD